jgi:hypothetical protein
MAKTWACLVILAVALTARADAPAEPPPEAIVGTLPFLDWKEPNRIVLNLARDGDREFRLMLDTGAEGSVLTPRYARDLGVNVRSARSREYERETRLGRNLQFWVDTSSSESASRTGWEYGLLGGNFFGDYVLDIDFKQRRVSFIDPDRWQVPKSVDAPNEAVLPLRVMGNRPFAKLLLEGKEVDVLLDTGDPTVLSLSGASAKHAGFDKPSLAKVDMAGVLGPIESYAVEGAELAFGPFKFAPVPIVFSPKGAYNMGGSSDSAAGYDLLCHFHVRIDYPHRRLWLRREDEEPLAWLGQPWATVRRAGVFATVGDGGIHIDGVLPDSPAAKLGIRAGDEIEFHGESRSKALEEAIAAIERGDRITVVRGGKEDEPPEQVELGGKKE